MSKKFYITTPIYYPSGNLHLGHAYTTTLADILNRYKKEQGYETFFLTGSDEHGQKIENKAKEANLTPLEYLNPKVQAFKDLWTKLNIDYDKFIRTTDDYHEKAVQKIFTILLEKGYIYKGQYEGIYCVSCEEFLTNEQIDENGLCKISSTKPQLVNEDTYFLKVSQFQEFVQNILKSDFLIPEYRRNEMLKNFVEPGLKDLSVTRVSFKWGIPITEDQRHIIYVWLDALSNYITALGYLQEDDSLFKKFWQNDDCEILQLAGKEIIRFHSIYWPVMLEALNLKQPTHLLGHGWILNKNTKMSKSLGNVIDPVKIIELYSADALRFYIANDLPTEKDGNFSLELFIESFNAHLANNVGNLISRTHNMISKYFNGYIDLNNVNYDQELIDLGIKTIDNYVFNMDQYKISEAIKVVLELSNACNKYIETKAPWNLEKENKIEELKTVLATLQRNIAIISYLLKPILVDSYKDMIEQSGLENVQIDFENLKSFSNIKFNKLNDKKVIFNRIKE
ncbi:methionine--tRNA ligase [Mycoplasma mycoides subsp. capri]|uniref:methionine--tRNA ligase n=1 Tax=Mycoplasma mycoides TaxID=2102 RepID=UPI00223FE8D9|nr:methionine--tRNA ligase [Mycoplasma mycoides]QVJ96339.1 methionine--tRNA ligase [Mycoplasma mycoides subsp. capri]QVJ97239.1 methionine--tRNA ligase [Mycoplasma mycoides subsp. capri]QVK00222.1 methionine--tRNA ligase [Mycoplasma mycoides subsp. capri]QVK01105.1 methionine--tRNA ligase [Mycoplasma mycoides subsp. capri]